MSSWNEKLAVYDALVAKCPRFERKGKTMPYTSANGYMFSLFNKAGEIGIPFQKKDKRNTSNNSTLPFTKATVLPCRVTFLSPKQCGKTWMH